MFLSLPAVGLVKKLGVVCFAKIQVAHYTESCTYYDILGEDMTPTTIAATFTALTLPFTAATTPHLDTITAAHPRSTEVVTSHDTITGESPTIINQRVHTIPRDIGDGINQYRQAFGVQELDMAPALSQTSADRAKTLSTREISKNKWGTTELYYWSDTLDDARGAVDYWMSKYDMAEKLINVNARHMGVSIQPGVHGGGYVTVVHIQ